MLFVNKLKVLTLMTCLVLVGQAFAFDCSTGATWGGYKTQEVTPEGTVYKISTPQELAWFSCYVTNNQQTAKSYNAELTRSIDMKIDGEKKLFIPIAAGGGSNKYEGTFDGKGYTISNLFIQGSQIKQVTNGAQNIGFVGVLSGKGKITRLTLENVEILAAVSAGSNGLSGNPVSVGSFVGWQEGGTLENCVASGTIISSGDKNRVGGISGNVKTATITNCVSTVNITATGYDTHVGGIVGAIRNNGTVNLSSCAYAGESLSSSGGSVGGIAGNYENTGGKVTTSNVFYSSTEYGGIGLLPDGKTFKTENEENLNSEDVVCRLNGGSWNENENRCSGKNLSSTWSVGQSSLSMNGSDGFVVTFDGNGGTFSNGALLNKIVFAKNAAIVVADGTPSPTLGNKKFAGWAKTDGAEEPETDLGIADGAKTVYAVWYDYYEVKFKISSEAPFENAVFPNGKGKEQTVKVVKHGVVSENGIDVPAGLYQNTELVDGEEQVVSYYWVGWAYESKIYELPDDCEESNEGEEGDDCEEGDDSYEKEKISLPINIDDLQNTTLYAIWTKAPVYHVTYHAALHGKTVTEFVKAVNSGNGVHAPENIISDAGYKVVGWYTRSACAEENNTCTDDDLFVFGNPLTSDMALYAKWGLITNTIEYNNIDGATQPPDNQTTYTVESDNIILYKPTKEGFNFDGWYYDNNVWKQKVDTIYTGVATGDKVLYAKWTPITYVVRYLSGNAVSGTTPNDTKEYGVPLTLKGIVDEFKLNGNCKQDGWTVKDLDPVISYALGGSYTTNDSITLYPHWSGCNTYTITYKLNGADQSDNDNPAKYTGPYPVKLNDPVYVGHDFVGWYTENKIEEKKRMTHIKNLGNNLVIYALWTPIVYTVTYNENGGSFDGEKTFTYTYDDENKTLAVPSKEWYNFAGWLVSGTEDVITILPHGSFGDKELVAQWTPAPFTIAYDLAGGTLPEGESNLESYTVETVVTQLVAPSKDNYTFDGWFTDADVKVTEIGGGMTGDLSLTARWTAVPFTVAYDLAGGALPEGESNPETYTVATEAIKLVAPSKENYEFDGWYTAADVKLSEIGGGMSGDLSLTARWTAKVYTIAYHNIEGATFETSNPTTYTVEDLPITLNNPIKDGYNFEGWFTDESFSGNPIIGIDTKLSEGNGDLYAKWSDPIEYTATYDLAGGSMEGNTSFTFTVESGELALATPNERVGFSFAGWLDGVTGDVVTALPAGSFGNRTLMAQWSLLPITVTASSGTFEYDGETHNATCSYEGVIPVGYSIAMVPSGRVKNVSEGEVTTSCAVTITDESGDDVTDQFTELTLVDGTISVVAKVVNYGGIAIIKDEDGTRAEIDDAAMTPINIPGNVEVDHVTFNRNFPLVKYSTVFLPFSIDMDKVHGAEFYSVAMYKQEGKWVAGASSVKTAQLVANTPYLLFAREQNLTFDGPVTLNTSEKHESTTVFEDEKCQWTFKGTYSKHVWEAGDPELGKVYAFSAHDVSDDIKIGKFTKFGKGAWIRPMRAYLIYELLPSSDPEPDYAPTPLLAKSFKSVTSTASIEDSDVPEWIDVVIIGDEGEQTTPIAQMNSRTGEIRMKEGWFDMKGRKLNGKPTAKGIYYNNGKRVIVK